MAGRAIAAFKKKRHGEAEKIGPGNGPETSSTLEVPRSTDAAPVSLEDRSRTRAYALYLQRDGQDGSAADDWLRAEVEILAG
jgi:hypothetical protein